MSSPVDISLILPAYNEAQRILGTIEEFIAYLNSRNYSYELIIAADGNDGTRELVREFGKANGNVRVIGHAERLGKGRGVREAVAIARGRIIGYADADNKVPIDEFDKLAKPLREGYPVVIGSRALSRSAVEKKQPLYRQIGSKGFHIFMKTLIGLPGIHDTQCGFKFFTHDAAKRLFGAQQIDGYMFDVEILALAQVFGYPIAEVPIRWRDDGDSRLDLISGNIKNVRDIFRLRMRLRRAAKNKSGVAIPSHMVTKG